MSQARRCLVLRGPHDWGLQAAHGLVNDATVVRWLGPGPSHLPLHRAQEILGTELDGCVLDLHARFDPDALGAVVGAVRAGGVLVVLLPAVNAGRFVQRFLRVAARHDMLGGQDWTLETSRISVKCLVLTPCAAGCKTADQRRAVDAVLKVARGRRRRPLVLTSDRGRGKSAALGIAAGELLGQGAPHLIVTAPGLAAVRAVFRHAREVLGLTGEGPITHAPGGGSLQFVPPGELLTTPAEANLVLVDEAAALPVPLLDRLLQRHSRIVFASTVHGYEGTGRGFAVRFVGRLNARAPGWRALEMHTPIRWAEDDPVEAFIFDALLLNATPPPAEAVAAATGETCTFERVDRDGLAQDEHTLRALFGLLVVAHYRTSPADLKRMLDAPNAQVWVAMFEGQVVGGAMVMAEGGLDAALAAEIHAGRRRPQGHMLPETLANHSGLASAPTLRAVRIVRVATHPAVQGCGVGGAMLRAIGAQAKADGVDYMGTSFGATARLLNYWRRAGLQLARVGVTRGKSSGLFSAVMVKALSTAGEALLEGIAARTRDELSYMLGDPLRDMRPSLALALLRGHTPPTALDEHDRWALKACAEGRRDPDLTTAALWRWAHQTLGNTQRAETEAEAEVLLAKILQRRSWTEVAALFGHSGKKGTKRALVAALKRALN